MSHRTSVGVKWKGSKSEESGSYKLQNGETLKLSIVSENYAQNEKTIPNQWGHVDYHSGTLTLRLKFDDISVSSKFNIFQ